MALVYDYELMIFVEKEDPKPAQDEEIDIVAELREAPGEEQEIPTTEVEVDEEGKTRKSRKKK